MTKLRLLLLPLTLLSCVASLPLLPVEAAEPARWLRSVGGGVPITSVATVGWGQADGSWLRSEGSAHSQWWLYELTGDAATRPIFVLSTSQSVPPVNIPISLYIVSSRNISLYATYSLDRCMTPGRTLQAAAAVNLELNPAQSAAQSSPSWHLYVAYQSYEFLNVNRYVYSEDNDGFQLVKLYSVEVSSPPSAVRLVLDSARLMLYLLPGYGVYQLDIMTATQREIHTVLMPRALALDPEQQLLYLEDVQNRRIVVHNLTSEKDELQYALPLPVNSSSLTIPSLLFDASLDVLFVSVVDQWSGVRLVQLDCRTRGTVIGNHRLARHGLPVAITSSSVRQEDGAPVHLNLYMADSLNDQLLSVSVSIGHGRAVRPSSSGGGHRHPWSPIHQAELRNASVVMRNVFIIGAEPMLSGAYDAVVDDGGAVYVNVQSSVIKKLTAAGDLVLSSSYGTHIVDQWPAMAVAVDGQSRLYAASWTGFFIAQYSNTGRRLATFSGVVYDYPLVLCADKQRPLLFVADAVVINKSVWMLETEHGAVVQRFTSPDSTAWQPMGLALDSGQQLLYVNDPMNQRLLVLMIAHGGQLKSTFPFQSNLGAPVANIAVDVHLRVLYVTDPLGARVMLMDSDSGNSLGEISAPPEQGEMAPTGVDFGANGTVYVADPVTNRLFIFVLNAEFVRERESMGSEARSASPASNRESVR